MKAFTLDYSKWRAGGSNRDASNVSIVGKGDTLLLNEEGFMCCLGQYCEQAGIPRDDLMGVGAPDSLSLADQSHLIPELALLIDSVPSVTLLCTAAVGCNDDGTLTTWGRLQVLYRIFKRNGITMTVVNLPPELQNITFNETDSDTPGAEPGIM